MSSLSARVSAGAGVVLVIFLVLTAAALERAFRESARRAMEERLFAQLYLLMAAAEVDEQGRVTMPERLVEPRLNLPASGLYAAIRGANGTVLWRSPSTLGADPPELPALPVGARTFRSEARGATPFFLAAMGVGWEAGDQEIPLSFDVAEDLRPFQAQIRHYRASLWSWLGAMAILLLALQYLVLRWGLRPLREAAEEVARIEAGRQTTLRRSYPRELQPLTVNLNALIRSERTQRERYRKALADLAHSLKTPLAVLRGLASTPGKDLAAGVEEQVGHMDRIVQHQLQRAATVGTPALSAPRPIRPVVDRLKTSLDKVHAARAVEVSIDITAGATFRGQEGDLLELIGNVLDNAYKWCARRVAVRARCEGDALQLTVEDDGPGLAPAQAARITGRGVRLDETAPGHGIGLAMVHDIVTAYGGTIAVGTASLGGLRLSMTLPGCSRRHSE